MAISYIVVGTNYQCGLEAFASKSGRGCIPDESDGEAGIKQYKAKFTRQSRALINVQGLLPW